MTAAFARRPRFLDLFSCAGLYADGLAEYGDVYAVDNDRAALRHNPYPSCCSDAVDALLCLLSGGRLPFTHKDGTVEWLGLSDFDAITGSPPCQAHSATRKLADAQGRGQGRAVDLLPITLRLLRLTGLPWVVENVERSPLRGLEDTVRLCGSSFGLKVQRHRLFLSEDVPLLGSTCDHAGAFDRDPITGKPRPWGVYYSAGDSIPSGGRTAVDKAHGHQVMGITHRTVPWKYLCEGLPREYGSHIGAQLAAHVWLHQEDAAS